MAKKTPKQNNCTGLQLKLKYGLFPFCTNTFFGRTCPFWNPCEGFSTHTISAPISWSGLPRLWHPLHVINWTQHPSFSLHILFIVRPVKQIFLFVIYIPEPSIHKQPAHWLYWLTKVSMNFFTKLDECLYIKNFQSMWIINCSSHRHVLWKMLLTVIFKLHRIKCSKGQIAFIALKMQLVIL